MPTATCAECGARIPIIRLGGNDELWQHADGHRFGDAAIHQLPQVTFREQALTAIRALAVTGKPFTLGDAHPMVQARPVNPQTEWPAVLREAVALGWVEWTGEFSESNVPSTKRSAVKVWRGTSAALRGAA